MFREIQVKNFRGFKDSNRLELAPLNVFIGPEGSGKSSVGHLLTMLKQTVETSDSTVVLYPGDQDSPLRFGTQSSLRYSNAEGPIEFAYRFDLPSYLIMEDPEKDTFGVPTQFLFGESIRFHCTLGQFKSKHLSVERFTYELYDTNEKSVTASTRRSIIRTKNKELTQFTVETDGYLLKNRTGRPWLTQTPTHFYGFPEELHTYYKNAEGLFGLSRAHETTLRHIYYIGSDRARFGPIHLWDGLRRLDVGHDGRHTISTLLGASNRLVSLGERKRNQPVLDILNELLHQLQLIHSMNIEDLETIEDGYAIKITSRKSKRVVDFTEAGKAVTQILPILVQCFCAPRNSTIVLDAPETHLSAQAQAILADILLDVIGSKEDGRDRNIQLIVSTHSDAFLRRLQRRVAEGYIPQKMVCAYHTTNYRRGVDVQSVPLMTDNQLNDLDQYFTFADDDRQTTIEVADNLPIFEERTLIKPVKPEPKELSQKKTRGPGRPKGSKNKPTVDISDKPKRGPGRPKGSKNKNSKPKEVRTVKDTRTKEKKENKRAKRLRDRHAGKLN